MYLNKKEKCFQENFMKIAKNIYVEDLTIYLNIYVGIWQKTKYAVPQFSISYGTVYTYDVLP